MRSKRADGSIRQRSKGIYQIRFSVGADNLTGERKRVSIHHKGTLESAKAMLRNMLKSIDDNHYIEPTKIKLNEFLQEWLATIHSQVSPKTHERYVDIVKNFLTPGIGTNLLTKLEPLAIQRFYTKLETGGRRDGKSGGLSPRTRLHIHRVLKLALKRAVRMRLIAHNPADDVDPPKPRRSSIVTLTVDQSASLLDAIRGKPIYWPVLIALTTGMRRGEICALRWQNVDFKKKTIRVVESLEQTKKGIRFKSPKTDRTRAVLLTEYALEELKAFKEKQKEELAELKITQTENTSVCGGYNGQPQWPTTITHQFERVINKMPDFPKVRFHDLRHSHATQLLEAGIHPKIAQERLGHSTITTTLDLYSHVTDTMQGEAVSKLDTAFRSVIKANHLSKPTLG